MRYAETEARDDLVRVPRHENGALVEAEYRPGTLSTLSTGLSPVAKAV